MGFGYAGAGASIGPAMTFALLAAEDALRALSSRAPWGALLLPSFEHGDRGNRQPDKPRQGPDRRCP